MDAHRWSRDDIHSSGVPMTRILLAPVLWVILTVAASAQCTGVGGVPFNCAANPNPQSGDLIYGGSLTQQSLGGGKGTGSWTYSGFMGSGTVPGVFTTVTGLQGIIVHWTTGGRPPSPSDGQSGFNDTIGVWESWNSLASAWVSGGSGGGVSSVGLSLPSSILTVSGSPVTTSGTLTGTLAMQFANEVWAGPTSGGSGAPTFRSLVLADLPSGIGVPGGSVGNIQTNAGSGTFGGLTFHQVTVNLDQFGATQVGVVPQSGGGTTNFLRADGSWAAPGGGGGGLTFSGAVTIGNCVQVSGSSSLSDAGAPCGGSGGPPTGAAGGALSQTYPNPSLANTAIITIAPYNAACDGTTNDAAAFNSAFSSGAVVYVPKSSTACVIATNSTWPSNAKITFAPGAAIKVTTGVTLTALSMIDPNVQTNIFQTAGTGAVVGLRACRPEWFGAARDGSTDDAAAIQKCETAMETVGGSPSTTPAVAMNAMLLSAGTYAFGKTLLVTPGPGYMVKWRGNGGNGHNTGAGAATTLKALASFTGTAGVWVTGTSANDAGGGEFGLSGFMVIPATAGTGASIGVLLGGGGASAILQHNSSHYSLIHDVSTIDFGDDWQMNDVRLVDFTDSSGLCSALSACHPLNIGTSASSSSFTGDSNFGLGTQFASNVSNGSGLAIIINNVNAGTIAGLRFNGTSIYYGQVVVGSTGGGQTQDIWFGSGFQADQVGSVGFNIGATGSNSQVTDIHINDGYVFGNTTTTAQLVDAFSSTGGLVNGLWVTGNILAQTAAGQYVVQTSGVSGLHLDHNTFRNPRNSGKAVVELGQCNGCETIGNIADNQYGTAAFQWFIETVSTMDYYVIANNISNGLAAAGTAVNVNVHDAAAGAHSSISLNW